MLISILSDLYSDKQDIQRILSDIGIDVSYINFDASPIAIWNSILGKLVYQEEKFQKLLITVSNEYNVLDKILPAYEEYKDNYPVETNSAMFTSPSNHSSLLTDMQQDLKSLRKDVDDFKLETKVELTKVNSKLNQLDEHLDQLTLVNRNHQADAKIGRNLLYIILGVLILFVFLLLAANFGVFVRG